MSSFDFGNFDANADYGSNDDFDLLPSGDYEGEIETAELVPTRSGGKMIKLKVRLDNNRVVWDNLNVECANEKAQTIALRQLQIIAKFNNATLNSEEDLEGLQVIAHIGMQKGTDGYRDRNVVKYYKGKEDKKSSGNTTRAQSRAPQGRDPRYSDTTQSGGAPKANVKRDELIDDEIPF